VLSTDQLNTSHFSHKVWPYQALIIQNPYLAFSPIYFWCFSLLESEVHSFFEIIPRMSAYPLPRRNANINRSQNKDIRYLSNIQRFSFPPTLHNLNHFIFEQSKTCSALLPFSRPLLAPPPSRLPDPWLVLHH
jgi:hypothetical protein